MKNFNSALIIDDDPVCNFITHEVLRKNNMAKEIHIARDGGKALAFLVECFEKQHSIPELILVDLNMPVMDGYEFLESFERMFPEMKNKTKIIIVSAVFQKNDISALHKMGFTEYFDKPLTTEKLRNAIEQELLKIMEKSL